MPGLKIMDFNMKISEVPQAPGKLFQWLAPMVANYANM